ncbi:hypothetical protein DFH29DRAFT_875013 [Suillus ampliporus]|nr:hypothetical protein DFH29DRAFT_875013 [Suillus ampliporus]
MITTSGAASKSHMRTDIPAPLEYVIEGIPNLLKDHLKCKYSDWDELVEDVQSPVQYIAPTPYPYYGSYGTATPAPVYTVMLQEEHSGWEGQDTWGTQEAGYDWMLENYRGLLPTTDQQ